ncbi:hypothetical protein SAMN06297468_0423 [Altererythrobacter xiamenensis]|uniref:Uncharacterized protein n=2 Tax=Altererythrobacter xiamenensis TaxID=1316679 RepID=A0A1Y6ED15_9SPHN|nr:hypothetical protein SAMN06297468_0423 [Altererythrobacter xiamenensis]
MARKAPSTCRLLTDFRCRARRLVVVPDIPPSTNERAKMADSYKVCSERADAAAEAARNATLDNVRQRELRAEKTWRGLATQAKAVDEQRQKMAREKAAQQEAQERDEEAASATTDA